MFVNYICSPEMSSNSISKTCEETGEDTKDVDSEPHAYVHFLDEAKVMVPLEFVHKFPKKWRTDRWDTKYLFKVFWSPDEEDTPQSILKKLPEIPVYEEGRPNKPGYYRGSVLAVEESKSSLLDFIERKRLSITPLDQKYRSFDKTTPTDQKATATSAKRTSSQKHQSSEFTGPTKPPKKKGINRDATRANLRDDSEGIRRQFPFLDEEACKSRDQKTGSKPLVPKEYSFGSKGGGGGKKSPNLASERSGMEDTKRKNKKARQEIQTDKNISQSSHSKIERKSASPGSDVSHHDHSPSLACGLQWAMPGSSDMDSDKHSSSPVNSELLTEIVGDAEHVTPIKVRPSRNITPRTMEKKLRESSSSSNSSVEVKKVKLDPDFTPVKYEALKSDLKISVSRLNQANLVNKKLRLSLEAMEASNKALKEEVENLKKQFQKKSDQKDIHKKKENTKPRSPSKVFESKERIVSNSSTSSKIKGHADTKARETMSVKEHKPTSRWEKIPMKVEAESEAEEDDNTFNDVNTDSDGYNMSHLCETHVGDGSHDNKPFVLLPNVVIPADVWALLQSVPKGEKKDIPFVKDLSTYAHGPETLASRSIFGTKKGGRKKKGEEPKQPKPGLNKSILQAVYGQLVKRVEKEEGRTISDPEEYERTSLTRYHEAIRGAQRRLQQLGFGTGTKTDSNIEIGMLQNQANNS